MITGELKSKVDRIWDTMWSGGISNPLSVIEQLTYLLFIKRLDEIQTLKESKAARTGKPIEDPIFNKKQNSLRWSRFKETAPEEMFTTVQQEVFPFIKTLGTKGDSDGEGNSTYTHHMKDALFMMPTPRVLANVVDQLDAIDMADRDTKGDLYEYMLGKIASAGQNGQFRTPRHIIKLMVEMTDPRPRTSSATPPAARRASSSPRPSISSNTTAMLSTKPTPRANGSTPARSTATTSTTRCSASAL
jgi:type I restriction enzyme M protein